MSTLTENYNLIKPDYTDSADIGDINGNMDIIDTAMKGLDDTKQPISDNTLTTTAKNVPGAINELDAEVALKQNITDNSLNTTAKTVPGAINELNAFVTKSFTATTRNSFQTALVAWGDTMADGSVGVAYAYPNFSDSVFDGSPQPAIMVRRQSGVYRVSFPCLCVDGYYYSSAWHWRKATMGNV